jgi:DNA polymerase III epsilon subunit-like protein
MPPPQLPSLNSLPVAVIDLETTGLRWSMHDRVVEIAVLLISPLGKVLKTYETLINPVRDLGPTHIHGIQASECLQAPQFRDVAGDILSLLNSAGAIAGHNVIFDLQFLSAELARMGLDDLEKPPTICTYRLLHCGLGEACDQFDVKLRGAAHSAMTDAQAAADLLLALQAEGEVNLSVYSNHLNYPCVPAFDTPTVTRIDAKVASDVRSGFLTSLSDRAAYSYKTDNQGELDYLSLLRRVLEDRVLDTEEKSTLRDFADTLGMSNDSVEQLHSRYLDLMVTEAWSDGILTEHEINDLRAVSRLLDFDEDKLTAALERAKVVPPTKDCLHEQEGMPASDSEKPTRASLEGSTVCFTGGILSSLQGEVITRSLATQLVTKAGLIPKSGVSKNLDILVVADPNTQSGKAKKAREYGTRIVAEREFWSLIGIDVS